MAKLTPALLVLLIAPLLISGKGKQPAMLRFHMESDEKDSIKKTTRILLGTKSFRVRKAPAFDQRDLTGFYPFPSEDKKSYGAAFRLNARAAKELTALGSTAAGKRLFTVINTEPINFVIIDGPIEDGYIVCWKGLSRQHMQLLGKSGLPQIEGTAPPAAAPQPASAPATSRPPAIPTRGEPPLPQR